MKRNRIKRSNQDILFDIFNTIILSLCLLLVLYPLYFVIIASISEPYEVARGNITFFPRGFTLAAYENVLKYHDVWVGYKNTVFYTAFGVLFSLFLTLTSAYVLSRKKFRFRRFFLWYFLITMYFSGGLIPTYLLVKSLGLINKLYTLIVLGAFSVFNMVITRTFFADTIPDELYESAEIDGAGEMRMFLRIALPLSGPIVAVMALYYGVGQWNSFFNALIYLSDKKLMPLQIVLRSILLLNQMALNQLDLSSMDEEALRAASKRAYMAQGMKYSLIFIASFPLLAAYPFVQKYFVKGVLIGSIKG
jgi:putative aldouronate transport system permease protein